MNIEKILVSIAGIGLLGYGLVSAIGKTEELKDVAGGLGSYLSSILSNIQSGLGSISLTVGAGGGAGTITNLPLAEGGISGVSGGTGLTIIGAYGSYPVATANVGGVQTQVISPAYISSQNMIDVLNSQVQSVKDIVSQASPSKYTLFQSMGGAYKYWSSQLMGGGI